MFDRILVPLDGTESAEKIIPYVEALADKFISEVILLTAVNPMQETYVGLPEGVMDEYAWRIDSLRIDSSIYLRQLQDRLRARGVRAMAVLVDGLPATSIADYAEQEDLSLIAMSAAKRGWFSRLIHGSVTDLVQRKTKVPVLVTRSD